jgi:hypothetical protein
MKIQNAAQLSDFESTHKRQYEKLRRNRELLNYQSFPCYPNNQQLYFATKV